MIIDQLRQLRDKQPFRPFEIHLTDGSRFRIGQPTDLMLTRGGDIALVDEADVLRILNHIQVTQATMPRARASRRVGQS